MATVERGLQRVTIREFAHNVSDHVVFMEKGQIAEQGSPSQIVDIPASQRLGACPGNRQVSLA